MGEQTDFGVGASGDDGPSGQETMGARYGIGVTQVRGPERGSPTARSTYLMPQVTYRNGGTERVADAIGQTPLGGMMPGPAMPPPQVPGHVGAFPLSEDNGGFQSGVIDAWPEGSPVPVR